MEQIILVAVSAGAILTLVNILIGFWMGKKLVRPEERVFMTDKVTNDDADILDTVDMFEELTNKEDNNERVETV